jgi:hypothetical protein
MHSCWYLVTEMMPTVIVDEAVSTIAFNSERIPLGLIWHPYTMALAY